MVGPMTDREFAIELVRRLNALLETDADYPGVRDLVTVMVERREPVSEALTMGHPTIQARAKSNTVGLLGLLNGICGVMPNGMGYVAGIFESEDEGQVNSLYYLKEFCCDQSPLTVECNGCGIKCLAKKWVEVRATDGHRLCLCFACTRKASEAPALSAVARAELLELLKGE